MAGGGDILYKQDACRRLSQAAAAPRRAYARDTGQFAETAGGRKGGQLMRHLLILAAVGLLTFTAGAASATPISDRLIVRPLGLGRIVERLRETAEPGTISIPIPPRVIEFTSNGRPTGTVGDRVTIGSITAALTSDGDNGAAIPIHLDPGAIVENVFNERSVFRLRFRSDDDSGANPSDSITVRANGHRLLRFNLSNRDERRGKSLTAAIPEIAFLFHEGSATALSDLFTISPFTMILQSTDDPAGLGHQAGAETFRDRSNHTFDLLVARAVSDPVETPEPTGSAILLAGLAGLGVCCRLRGAAQRRRSPA